jgi:hypothetical protein
MFAELHLDINSPKSNLLHLTVQPYSKKSRSAKVKDGIINLFLRNNLIDRYKNFLSDSKQNGRESAVNRAQDGSTFPEAVFLVVCDPSMNEL